MRNLNGYLKRKLSLFSILFLPIIFLLNPQASFANSIQDNTSLLIIYDLTSTGDLSAQYNYTIKNTTQAPIVLTSYNFSVPFTSLNKDTLLVGSKSYKYSKHTNSSYTDIFVSLNTEAISANSSITISFKFEISSFLEETEFEVISLSLPIGNTDMKNTSVVLNYPLKFPNPNWASISDFEFLETKLYKTVKFSSVSLAKLNLTLGNASSYSFVIDKILINGGDLPTQFHIVVPSWDSYQYTTFSEITPQPDNINVDEQGNTQFSYYVKPELSTKVTIRGSVIKHTQKSELKADFSEYLPLGYWRIEDVTEISRLKLFLVNSGIDKLSYSDPQATTPEQRNGLYKAIYDYALDRLTPLSLADNPYGVIRSGASEALKHKGSSSTDDYADLIVALYRTLGIPARTVSGYIPSSSGYSEIGIYHTWAQFWNLDSGNWISVDPIIEDLHRLDMFDIDENDRVSLTIREFDPLNPKLSYLSADEFKIESATNISDVNSLIRLKLSTESNPIYSLLVRSQVKLNIDGNVPMKIKSIQILGTDKQVYQVKNLNILKTVAPLSKYVLDIQWIRHISPSGTYTLAVEIEDLYGETQRYLETFELTTVTPVWWYPLILLILFTSFSGIIYVHSLLKNRK